MIVQPNFLWGRMTIITACGSGKAKALIHDICSRLQRGGATVLTPPLHDIDGLMRGVKEEGLLLAWKGATFAHFNRIVKSNVCLIVNAGGYLGVGSTLELGYAASLGKLIIALRRDITEPARDILFDIVLDTEDPGEISDRVLRISNEIG